MTKLETKLAFQEHTIETLNGVVIRQQDQIHRLEKEIRALRAEMQSTFESMQTNPAQEKPPHY